MSTAREKFSSQMDPMILAATRKAAADQGRQFQSILEDALEQYLERNQSVRPRTHVLEAFGLSLREFDELYAELAK